MTIDEASERYKIPLDILREYESWGLCDSVKKVMGAWQYDGQDIERLSLIMTLHDIGFEKEEIETYMTLTIQGSGKEDERLLILEKKRSALLDEIHFREKKLANLDYLRYEMGGLKKKGRKRRN